MLLWLRVPHDERQLRLRVRDDVKGIDPKFLTAEGPSGHFGLHGMRERAELVGGKLTVWSARYLPRRSSFAIPAVRAHAESAAPCRAWFGAEPAQKSSQSTS
jgi:signal transduction histidine kinase